MGALSVADLPEWVWLGNVDHATYGRIDRQFNRHGIALGIKVAKGRADITREDRKGIARMKAHFGDSSVHEVWPTLSTEEMHRRGMLAVHIRRADLARGVQLPLA